MNNRKVPEGLRQKLTDKPTWHENTNFAEKMDIQQNGVPKKVSRLIK